jgi:hypothetical protein
MEYCIINKIEYVDNQVIYTPFGYTADMNECEQINSTYYSGFTNWINENKTDLENGTKSISEFFQNNPKVYEANMQTTSIGGMDLNLITFSDI